VKPDLSVSATPVLAEFESAGLLGWGDVHAATKIGFLYGEPDDRVRLALALTVAALRAGSVCLDLTDVRNLVPPDAETTGPVPADLWPDDAEWRAALRISPMVAVGPDAPTGRPLRLVDDLLYLERYWRDESIVADDLTRRQTTTVIATTPAAYDTDALRGAIDTLFSNAHPDVAQTTAVAVALLTPVSVIAGGPGTGKTATIARVLAGLLELGVRAPGIALAAPTGKAAARMEEATADAAAQLPGSLGAGLAALHAQTIHRLLGWVPDSRNRFAHNAGNPLPHDVVVVDEASMVSLPLMARLLEALRPDARLILVGDPDQLAPVEAGAVLSDIVEAVPPPPAALSAVLRDLGLPPSRAVVRLRTNWRFSGALAELAEAVLAGDDDEALRIVNRKDPAIFVGPDEGATDVQRRATDAALAMIAAATRGDAAAAIQALGRHRVLCAHRHGPFGVSSWTRKIETWMAAAGAGLVFSDPWYPGRPLLVTQNAPDVGLWNGDTGVVVADSGGPRACFARGHAIASYSVFTLDEVETAHAMTVHKAQGSQFDQVTLVLPPPDSPLLTRELLYTAITRAREHVTLIGTEDSLRAAVRRKARRASGLAARLGQPVVDE